MGRWKRCFPTAVCMPSLGRHRGQGPAPVFRAELVLV